MAISARDVSIISHLIIQASLLNHPVDLDPTATLRGTYCGALMSSYWRLLRERPKYLGSYPPHGN